MVIIVLCFAMFFSSFLYSLSFCVWTPLSNVSNESVRCVIHFLFYPCCFLLFSSPFLSLRFIFSFFFVVGTRYLTKLKERIFVTVTTVYGCWGSFRRHKSKKRYSIYLKHGMCFTNSVDSCQESTIIVYVYICVPFVLCQSVMCFALQFYYSNTHTHIASYIA